jgi:CRP-like cAMP-binding protein
MVCTVTPPRGGALAVPGLAADEVPLVSGLPLFGNMPGTALGRLLQGAAVRTLVREETLFLQEDPADAFFIVLEGWIRLFRIGEDGGQIVIAVFTRGESFAEAAIFGSKLFPVGADAIEDSRVLVVPAGPFTARLREEPDLALNIMGSMSRHLRYMVQHVEQLNLRSSAERLAAFIARLSRAEEGADIVRLPLDKSLIAGRLAMRPETLSRNFAKLTRSGLLSVRGSEVRIADVEALRTYGEGS